MFMWGVQLVEIPRDMISISMLHEPKYYSLRFIILGEILHLSGDSHFATMVHNVLATFHHQRVVMVGFGLGILSDLQDSAVVLPANSCQKSRCGGTVLQCGYQ